MTVTTVEHRLASGTTQLAASGDSKPIVFHASTTLVNRYGFVLRADRWRLENYRANPVLLWGHDPSIAPIGRTDVDQRADGLHARLDFDLDDPFAAMIENKVRGGYLNAVSVSWDYVLEDGSPVDSWWGLKQEQIDDLWYDLCEISVVPVPGDAHALRELSRLAEAARAHRTPANPRAAAVASADRQRVLDTLALDAFGTEVTPADRERLLEGFAAFGGQRALAAREQEDERINALISSVLVGRALAGERRRLRLEAIEDARTAEARPWSARSGYFPSGSVAD